jgi:hypothetical protein
MTFEKTFNLSTSSSVQITHLPAAEITKIGKTLVIQNSAYFYLGFHLDQDPLLLPKIYAALTYLVGPSDNWYDEWKGSDSFTFKLQVNKSNVVSHYVYHLYHYRSYINIEVRQIVAADDPRDSSIIHQPNETLFSDDEICLFTNRFCMYCVQQMEEEKHTPKPFVKSSASNALFFGFADGEYYCENYTEHDE